MLRFRDEIPVVVERIAEVYARFSPSYVKIEMNGLGLGVAQYVMRLGIPVKKLMKGTDKLENSTSAQLLMKSGKVWLPDNVPWIEECEDELFAWTGLPTEQDDIVDTLSDAANDVGPTTDVLDEDVAEKLSHKISFSSRNFITNSGLSHGSPMARTLKTPFYTVSQPDVIRRESQ
jgi:predicted phage terminase large subunit-like protein